MKGRPVEPLISCVTENSAPWFEKTFNLVLSVRSMGGTLADAPLVVNFVTGCDDAFRGPLEALGARVRIVEPWGARFSFSNKLRMLELDEHFDFDILVMLDCDMLVTGDIAPYLDPAAVSIAPEDRDLLTPEQWHIIFEELGVEPPVRDCVMRVTGQRTYPYYNSGVIFLPRAFLSTVGREWQRFLAAFDALQDRFPGAHHENQVALALAVMHGRIPIRELPPSMNLPTGARLLPSFAAQIEPPLIIHYHKWVDEQGFVLAAADKRLNPAIHDFNARRAAATGRPYSKLPRLPLARRLHRRASKRSWYSSAWLRKFRRLPLAGILKRKVLG
jgi:hypothetical protein